MQSGFDRADKPTARDAFKQTVEIFRNLRLTIGEDGFDIVRAEADDHSVTSAVSKVPVGIGKIAVDVVQGVQARIAVVVESDGAPAAGIVVNSSPGQQGLQPVDPAVMLFAVRIADSIDTPGLFFVGIADREQGKGLRKLFVASFEKGQTDVAVTAGQMHAPSAQCPQGVALGVLTCGDQTKCLPDRY